MFGGSGLVGSSLRTILEKSNKVESLFYPTRKEVNLFNLENVKNYIKDIGPDVIVNAAAKVGGIYANNTYRTDFILENLKININIFEACIPYPDIKIINLGSSCIYPLNAENPIQEKSFMTGELEPTNSPYATAKITAIEMGLSMKIQYGHQVINLMPTNLYGPNDNFSDMNSHVIPALIHRMHKAKLDNSSSFSIWGTGSPLREFLFVDDLSNAIEFLIDKNIDNDILNVGSSEEVSIKNLAEKIKSTIGFNGELAFDSSKPDGNPRKLLDSSIINSLGWKSSINLSDGLEKTYLWYTNNIV
ncbi:GDP-L-fucose synthase [Acidimicrobiaceae bacterium]|nr:GDP-L-fucose synthase [Acidimicrobiaceae bacterium]